MKKLITIVLSLLFAASLSYPAIAGSLDSPGAPSAGSGMYTLQNLYDYLTSGTALTVQTSFQEPPSGPTTGTMKSTKQIGDAIKALHDQCLATGADVKSGVTFFCTQPGSWGVRTGTALLMPTPTPTATPIYASCKAIKTAIPTASDGVYTIDPDGAGSNPAFSVYCDMSSDGGGWTLVARTISGGNNLNCGAVGTLTSPTQSQTGKLSDTMINMLATTHLKFSCGTAGPMYFDPAPGFSACAQGGCIFRYQTTYASPPSFQDNTCYTHENYRGVSGPVDTNWCPLMDSVPCWSNNGGDPTCFGYKLVEGVAVWTTEHNGVLYAK